ncbi:UNVERIFIED_CONTAM: hypothetical protein FKN15_045440 [Acipenser sinensis]
MIRTAAGIVQEEGPLKLWQGITPAIYRHIDLATYDSVKHVLLQNTALQDNIKCHGLSSICSGLVAAAMGTPADVIKTRIMNQPRDSYGRGDLDWLSDTFVLLQVFLPVLNKSQASLHQKVYHSSHPETNDRSLNVCGFIQLVITRFYNGLHLVRGGPRQCVVSANQGFYERPLQKSQMLGTSLISSRGAALRVITLICVFGCWVLCPWDVSASSPSASDLFSILSSVAGSSAPGMCRHRRPQSVTSFLSCLRLLGPSPLRCVGIVALSQQPSFLSRFGCWVLCPWDVSASSPSVSEHFLSY